MFATGRGFRLIAVATALVVLLSACGGGGGNGEGNSNEPKQGGTLRLGLVRTANFDPGLASTVSERVLADILYDGLTTWDPKSLAPVPALAERWTASTDQKHWTFRLKQNIFAANNDAITASDVKATLQRIAHPKSQSPVKELLSIISGYEAFSKEQSNELSGVVVLDNTSLRIDLDTASADVPRLLGNPNFGIIHPIAGNDFMTTGSFAVVNRVGDTLMTLRKTERSAARLDQVDVKFFADAGAAYDAITSDQLDWTPIPPEKATEAGQRYGTEHFRQSLRALYLSFNLQDPKFADQRFREAIVHAINRAEVARSVSITSSPLNGVVVQGVPGALEDSCGTTCRYDVEEARALLKDVFGDQTPPAITIDIATGPPFTNEAVNRIARDLGAVGIPVQIRPTTAGDFGPVTVQADRQIFQTAWSAAYPSPDAFLSPLFKSSSPANVTRLQDAKIESAIVKAQGEGNSAQRIADWQNVERSIMGTVPLIPVAQFPVNSVASDRVHDIRVLPTGNFDITPVWVD